MSNALLTEIRERSTVRGPARAVLMALADRANDSGKCWPSHATIARDSGVCVSTVKTALRNLRAAGFVTWTNTTTEDGDPGCNIYQVTTGGRAGDTPPQAGHAARGAANNPPVRQGAPEGGARAGYKASMEAPRETSLLLDGASSNPPASPPNPQRGILPDGWKKLNKTEQGRKKVNFNNPLMIRIGKFLSQRETTLWTIAEYLALQDVSPSEDDLELIEMHYSLVLENNGYRFKGVLTLLNKWPMARTRAEAYFQEFPDHRAA